jgi:E3 ubiquitin-protein ligase BRE1
LRAQLKRAQNDVKEMKLLLDMYKTCTKEQRDKAQLMAAEKKVRTELEDTRNQVTLTICCRLGSWFTIKFN